MYIKVNSHEETFSLGTRDIGTLGLSLYGFLGFFYFSPHSRLDWIGLDFRRVGFHKKTLARRPTGGPNVVTRDCTGAGVLVMISPPETPTFITF
jgi:hypothetical protein